MDDDCVVPDLHANTSVVSVVPVVPVVPAVSVVLHTQIADKLLPNDVLVPQWSQEEKRWLQ